MGGGGLGPGIHGQQPPRNLWTAHASHTGYQRAGCSDRDASRGLLTV